MKRGFFLVLCLFFMIAPPLQAGDFFGGDTGHSGDHVPATEDTHHDGTHHDEGAGNGGGDWFYYIPTQGGKTNLSLNISKGVGAFRLNANIPLGQTSTILALLAASTILVITFLPLEYQLWHWLGFKLKSEEQLEKEALALLQTTRTVYAGPLRFVNDYSDYSEIPQTPLRRVIMKWQKTYNNTANVFQEFCRKLNWFSNYRHLTEYPYNHFENRLSTTLNWLQRYRPALKNKSLEAEFDDIIENLSLLLDEVRNSYEFAQEKNYMRLINEIKKSKDGQLLTFNANLS
jgi:hypothetical protein